MTRKERRLFIVIGAIIAVYLATAAVVGISVYRAGMLIVEVDSSERGGDSCHVRVPAALAHVALRFVPDHVFAEPAREAAEWLPVVRAACLELGKSPDGVLLEVRSPDEQISVVKNGRRLRVDVNNAEERVHVVMPLALVGQVLARIDKVTASS